MRISGKYTALYDDLNKTDIIKGRYTQAFKVGLLTVILGGLCLLLLWLGISQGYPEILVIFAEMLFPLLFLLLVLLPYLHRRKEAAETWDAVTDEDLKYINASPREIFHQVLITMDGLISRTVYGDVMIRFPDIVWVYGVDTQHRINGINSGKSSGVIIGTRNHKRFYVLYDQKQTILPRQMVTKLMDVLIEHDVYPVYGYSKELDREFRKDFNRFLQRVD